MPTWQQSTELVGWGTLLLPPLSPLLTFMTLGWAPGESEPELPGYNELPVISLDTGNHLLKEVP